MQTKFMAAINQLATEKNLPKDRVVEIVSHALRAAYRKDYGNRDQNIRVDLNPDSGVATVFLIKEVVADGEEIENLEQQMSISEAKKYKKDAKAGDEVDIDVTPADYGRIAAQSAKQVIIQRIQEAEKDIITDMYKDREHEILNGYINRVEGSNVYVDLDRTQAVLRSQDQIPRENYHNGQRIKVYLDKVISSPKGPRLLISRSHPRLVNCLLELEIPEVREGTVEVKSIAREPGVRTKVTVASSDPNIDPIGACVGQKGVRIQNVMEEFNGERIDIIEHTDDELKMLTAALAPAKISHIEFDQEGRRAKVYVPVEERALAIGKGGQNVRLASNLTKWEIDIIDLDKLDTTKLDEIKKAEMDKKIKVEKGEDIQEKKVVMPVAAEDIKDLPGMSADIAEKLEAAGFVKSIQLMGLNAAAMTAIEGISQEEAELVEGALKGDVKEEKKKKVSKKKDTDESEETAEVKEKKEKKSPKKKKEESPEEEESNDSSEEGKEEAVEDKKKKPAKKPKKAAKKKEDAEIVEKEEQQEEASEEAK
ncbi:MAG: transcription termination factor NusA [Candidatus Gracilibacteria bacterium]|nr:transcription termination factor NusA [Candidatus Gracilibacteria bacterium]